MSPLFSVIVVCLNPGDKLLETLKSIEEQTFRDYEVIIKDGLSTDGSLDCVHESIRQHNADTQDEQKTPPIRLIEKKDESIYNAMNQAVEAATGSYLYFLNCGDCFAAKTVLQELADVIGRDANDPKPNCSIYYGHIYERKTQQKVMSNPHLDAFGCYRNVPCHQACFYSRKLLTDHPFLPKYKVRADYEQFLWCFFKAEASVKCQDMTIADYEGGGFSETGDSKKISAAEHKEITKMYFSGAQRFKYKLILILTLAPLRTYLASNQKTAGAYNRMKSMLYHKQ